MIQTLKRHEADDICRNKEWRRLRWWSCTSRKYNLNPSRHWFLNEYKQSSSCVLNQKLIILHTLAAISHRLKAMKNYTMRKPELLLIDYRSYGNLIFFYKIKRDFFQVVAVLVLLYGCTTWTLTKHMKKMLDGNCTRIHIAVFNKFCQQNHKNSTCAAAYLSSHKASKVEEIWNSTGEVRTTS